MRCPTTLTWVSSTGGLGHVFEIMNTNIKKYAVGSPAQAAVQGAEDLLAQHEFTADQVIKIEIKLPAGAAHVTDDRNIPDINTQYLVAGTLIDRGFSFAMAHDVERMDDPAIRKLRDVSTIVPDPTTDGTRSAPSPSAWTTGGSSACSSRTSAARWTTR